MTNTDMQRATRQHEPAQHAAQQSGNADSASTALSDTSETITIPTTRAGVERLLRATAHLIENDDNDPMKVAVRVAVEQLYRKDSALRRECLTFAAEQLADARSRWRVHTAQDEILIDLLRAACLARTGKELDARALVADSRERARNVVERRQDELTRLDSSDDPAGKARAAMLRKEPVLSIDELDAIAADVQRNDG
jgi:hypothetical protein